MTAARTVLITGATGFIGAYLARRLVADGVEVHLVVRPGSDLTRLGQAANRLATHVHDGTTEGMNAIVGAAHPDVVMHLASLFLAQHSPAEVSRLIESNVLFGTQLVEAMVQHGVTRLVNTGTAWQHFENQDYNPVNLYAATKEAFEAVLAYYVDAKGLRVVTLQLYDTYGPDDARPKLFTILQRAADRQQLLAMSPGEQLLDLVYIDDVIEAYCLAVKRLSTDEVQGHERYAVSSGEPRPLRALVAEFEAAAGTELPIRWGGRPYRPREVMRTWDRGRPLPGWRPSVSLADGLRRTLAAERPS